MVGLCIGITYDDIHISNHCHTAQACEEMLISLSKSRRLRNHDIRCCDSLRLQYSTMRNCSGTEGAQMITAITVITQSPTVSVEYRFSRNTEEKTQKNLNSLF